MSWSPQQDRALLSVADWLRDSDQQVFRLFGYAGSGKTTLARHFAEGVDGTVMFGAYTGKAAHVLRTKGCLGASTIHSMIYRSKDKGQARLKEIEAQLAELMVELGQDLANDTPEYRKSYIDNHPRVKDLRLMLAQERTNLSRPAFSLNTESDVRSARLVVIDECSMVDDRMGEDLLSFGVKVLVLGDPAQLPPVGGAGFFTEKHQPDVMLTDIHRQAADSPIIHMATRVRNHERLELGSYGESRYVERSQINQNTALEADQILVGRNATRTSSNSRVRSLLGRPSERPIAGDKLVCLRNNHDKGLLNGAIWEVDDVGSWDGDRCRITVSPEDGGESLTCEAHTHYFRGEGQTLAWYERKEAEEFDYGYALTVHKSQGSQWPRTLLFDESSAFRDDRWRWLYTGLTRAAEAVTVVRM